LRARLVREQKSVMTIRVHLADDHTMFREGLDAILSSREGIEVVGRSSTGGEDAFSLVGQNKPDVVVAEIDADLYTAKKILSGLRSASSGSRLIVLTMFGAPCYLKVLSKIGIDAYVHKSSSAEELVATIDDLGRDPGGDNMVLSMPRGSLERINEGPMGALSERENEVVMLAARGLSNDQIATHLHLASSTVKRHLANVYLKVGVGSRGEATRMALMEQWIDVNDITCAADPDGVVTVS
jgi:DNA-binding NarL/FixJ family response regulator